MPSLTALADPMATRRCDDTDNGCGDGAAKAEAFLIFSANNSRMCIQLHCEAKPLTASSWKSSVLRSERGPTGRSIRPNQLEKTSSTCPRQQSRRLPHVDPYDSWVVLGRLVLPTLRCQICVARPQQRHRIPTSYQYKRRQEASFSQQSANRHHLSISAYSMEASQFHSQSEPRGPSLDLIQISLLHPQVPTVRTSKALQSKGQDVIEQNHQTASIKPFCCFGQSKAAVLVSDRRDSGHEKRP